MTTQRRRGSMSDAAGRQTPTEPQDPRTPVDGPPRRPPRIKPYKATFDLDGAQLRAARIWAARHGVIGVAPVVRGLLTALTTDPAVAAQVQAALPAQKSRRTSGGATLIKTTYDLDPPLYHAFRLWVAEHDTTGASVLRILLSFLATDDGQFGARLAP